MNKWIYEPKDDMIIFVGETQAIFIKLFRQTSKYLQTIENSQGNILVSLTGYIEDLSPEILSLCST
jgi:energy-converting hydrogenase Eha subunit A